MGDMNGTTIVRMCGIEGCTNWVRWVYDPGEPMTRDYPGTPDGWFPESGCDKVGLITVQYHKGIGIFETTHLEELANDREQERLTDYTATQCYDNVEDVPSLVDIYY